MKKFKKIIILLLLIIMLSGCKINSNVELKKDGKVIENVTIITNIKNDASSKEELLSYINSELENYQSLIKYGNYKYEIIDNKNDIGVEFFKTYDSICSYFQNTIFNQYEYKHIKCSDEDDYIIIENDTPHNTTCEDCLDNFDLGDIEISFKLPVEAYDNDADIQKENTYIWKFDKNTSESKTFKFKISKRDLESVKENYEAEQKLQKKISFAKITIIVLIALGLLFFIVCILYKKYRDNKLKYY